MFVICQTRRSLSSRYLLAGANYSRRRRRNDSQKIALRESRELFLREIREFASRANAE